jgi:hypothetical protein
MQEWNGVRPSVKPLLSDFYIYLADSKIIEIENQKNILFATRTTIRYDILKRCYKFQYRTTESMHYGAL